MKHSLTLEHIEISESDREKLEEKLDRLYKHLVPPYEIDALIAHDTHHTQGDVIRCRINIEQEGKVYHAERSEGSVQDAIDSVIAALRSELLSSHDRRKDHHE
jgi:ribosomal subunit interface protein